MIGIPKTLRQEKHINRVLTKSHGAICSSAMAHSQNALVPLPRHSELPISSSCIKNVAAMLLERVAAESDLQHRPSDTLTEASMIHEGAAQSGTSATHKHMSRIQGGYLLLPTCCTKPCGLYVCLGGFEMMI